MIRKIFSIFICLILVLSLLTGCGQDQKKEATQTQDTNIQETKPETQTTRTITDLTGKQVEIPTADKIQKVIIIAPPLAATYINVVKDTDKLVGLHPMSIQNINRELLPQVLPNWEKLIPLF